jgi:hypothetical protein
MTRHASLTASAAIGVLITGIAVASPAIAAQINLGGYVGPVAIKFNSYESFIDSSGNLTTTLAVGDQNFGAFNITSITAETTGKTIWTASPSNGFLVGLFNDITVSRITPLGPAFVTGNTGGQFAIYNLPYSSFPTLTQGTNGYLAGGCTHFNTLCYNTLTNVAGHTAPVLTMDLVPGADTTNPAETLAALASTTTIPTSGAALGWMDITGGSDASQFGKGGFTTAIGTAADMSLFDDFCPNPIGKGAPACGGTTIPIGNWQQLNFDPVGAEAIPEPVSLGLLGTALMGMGVAGWRRRRRGER